MQYLGDYAEDDTVYFLWSSNASTGASVTRATNGTVSVYKDNGTTQTTTGVTDTEDFDTLTGIHACTIDLSADAFYVAGADYAVVLSAATIDGQTVNAVLAHFSIENRSVGKDSTITAAKIASDAIAAAKIAAGAITSAKFAAGAIDATAIADGAIDAATFAAGAITASAIAADAITDAKVAADVTIASVTGAVGSVTGNVGGSIGSLAAQAKADVNAEVVDALATDTYAEPGQGAPAATASLATKLGFLFKAWRNRHTQTATEYALYADDALTKDQEAVVSDDGTTTERGEVGSGA